MSKALKDLWTLVDNWEKSIGWISEHVKEISTHHVIKEGEDLASIEKDMERRLLNLLPIQTVKSTMLIEGVQVPVIKKRVLYLNLEAREDDKPSIPSDVTVSTHDYTRMCRC